MTTAFLGNSGNAVVGSTVRNTGSCCAIPSVVNNVNDMSPCHSIMGSHALKILTEMSVMVTDAGDLLNPVRTHSTH